MPRYRTPNGDAIIGTLEHLPGIAQAAEITREGEPIHTGYTEIDWNASKTVKRDGKILFVCESGEHWTFDQLIEEEDQDE